MRNVHSPAETSLKLFRVTITGADDMTSARDLLQLQGEFPFVEWGILVYPDQPAGKGNARYPSREWVHDFFKRVPQGHKALHLCGESVPRLIAGDAEMGKLAARFGRVQLNFNQRSAPQDLAALDALIGRAEYLIITQHNPNNAEVTAALTQPRHQVVFDASEGRGLSPERWPAPIDGKTCGYAGGLSPDNLEVQLPAIARAAGEQKFWIDMESGVRDPMSDTFDLHRVEQVLRRAAQMAGRAGASKKAGAKVHS